MLCLRRLSGLRSADCYGVGVDLSRARESKSTEDLRYNVHSRSSKMRQKAGGYRNPSSIFTCRSSHSKISPRHVESGDIYQERPSDLYEPLNMSVFMAKSYSATEVSVDCAGGRKFA